LRSLGEGEAANGAAIGHSIYLASPPAAAGARRRLAERIAALAVDEGQQTLLIDGDLAVEAASERAGLIDLLRGDQTVADLAYRDEGEGFARLARGGGDPFAASSRPGSDSFRLRRVRRCYDLVLLDGGAMADNLRIGPLAAQADLVLLVALVGAPQTDVMREVEAALAAGARFDAVALIDAGDA
jgi:Mrp family chromosome partitioning ATPase